MRHNTTKKTKQQEEVIYGQMWEEMMDDPECAYSINQFCEVLVDEIKFLDKKTSTAENDFRNPT